MATWTNISADTWKINYTDAAPTYMSGNVRLTLQYDADSETPTSIKIRFKLDRTNTSNHYNDSMYVIYNANEEGERKVYKLKDWQTWQYANWPYYSSAITISKAYDAEKFRVQDVWICNIGQGTVSGNYVTYESGTKTFYDWFKSGGVRQSYAYRQDASVLIPISKSTTVATAGTKGTFTVTDNGNNTFTVSGKLGKNGTNNAIKSATVYYTTDGSSPSNSDNTNRIALAVSGASSEKSYTFTKAIPSSCTVIKTWVSCVFAHNTATTSTGSTTVKYRYGANPGKPVLSYSKTRLTIKEPLTYTWADPIASTDYLPLSCFVGYRIRLKKNGYELKISTGGSTDIWYDTHNTSNKLINGATCNISGTNNTFTFDPAKFGFAPGDYVSLTIYASNKDGNNTGLWNGKSGGEAINSDSQLIQNAGIMHVKVNGTWREGQVWVKDKGSWHEAESVQTKVSGKWEESE